MSSRQEIKNQIRESLGLPPQKPEKNPTVPIEGHVCDFPLWSYSRKRTPIKTLHIDYDDGSFFTLDAPKGMPSPSFIGYLDVILFFGQHDLFKREYIEISVYSILQRLDIDPHAGSNYQSFRFDMEKSFAVTLKTDRFINPKTGERSHINYFRILQRMELAKYRQGVSAFYFDNFFLESFRSGYLKRLDFEYCINLDRNNKPLARFLYGHILKRVGDKSTYTRKMLGFLYDIGLGYIAELPTKERNRRTKQVLFPVLDNLRGKAFTQWEMDDRENIFFVS
jgi:hypothetical protein